MRGLNENGNSKPKYWIKNNRLYRVKVKLTYKSEGLERLFLQLIKEKLTNLDKFLSLNYQKILNLPLFVPDTRISETFAPINMSHLKSCPHPHFKKDGGWGGRGEETMWHAESTLDSLSDFEPGPMDRDFSFLAS